MINEILINNHEQIIFIVDDKLENLKVLSDILKQDKYKVRCAPDGNTALKMIRTDLPNLILLDILMPVMDGYELCYQLKSDEKTKEIPIIFISALNEPLDKVRAFNSGGVDYITKPFQVEEVLSRVKNHLALSHMQKKLEVQNSRLQMEISERKKAEDALQEAHDILEIRVKKRTNALLKANEELRKSGELLRKAQKAEALATLAGGIAHDFNNILFSIRGNAEIAELGNIPKDHPVRHCLQQIVKGTERAASLIRQIISFSRQKEHEFTNISIHPIIKEAVKLLRSSLPSTTEIRLEQKARHDMCMGDPSRIHQVVMNLCTNAAYAMKENGGILGIQTDEVIIDENNISEYNNVKPGYYIKMVISDTGEGIPEAVMDRIFDPYFTTKPVDEGTGLGLAVVLGIVKSMNGTLTAESQKDKGSSFTILIPLITDAFEAEKKKKEYKPIPPGRERILLVDDETDLTDTGKRMLEALGYTVSTENRSVEALKSFKEIPDCYDMVISDLTMPKMTGDKLAEEILKIRPDIPVIICTGFSEKITKEKIRAIGVRELLMKPLVLRQFAESVRTELDRNKQS